jgi:hypothetical protein
MLYVLSLGFLVKLVAIFPKLMVLISQVFDSYTFASFLVPIKLSRYLFSSLGLQLHN